MSISIFNNLEKYYEQNNYELSTDESRWADFLRKSKMKIINIMIAENKNITWLSKISGVDEEEIKDVLDFSEDIYLSAMYEISKYLGYLPEIKFTKEYAIRFHDEWEENEESPSVISKEEDMWNSNKEINEFVIIGIE